MLDREQKNPRVVDDQERMLARRLDSGWNDVAPQLPSRPIFSSDKSDTTTTLIEYALSALRQFGNDISPSVGQIVKDQTPRIAHLSDLLDLARDAFSQQKPLLAAHLSASAVALAFAALNFKPELAHPGIFNSRQIFATEGIRVFMETALERQHKVEKEASTSDPLTREALSAALADWNGPPKNVPINVLERMVGVVMKEIQLLESSGTNSKESWKLKVNVENLLEIAQVVVTGVSRFCGEAGHRIANIGLPVEYSEPTSSALIEHHLLTSRKSQLRFFYQVGISMVHFGQIAERPDGYSSLSKHMNHEAMLETGRRILIAMRNLSEPFHPDSKQVLAAYRKERLNLDPKLSAALNRYFIDNRQLLLQEYED